MSPGAPDQLLSVSQAARLLGVHANTIRAWTEAGRLAAYRINERGDRRYRSSDVLGLLIGDHTGVDEGQRAGDEVVVGLGMLANGIAGSTLPAGVATAAVEALRTNLGVARAAIYAATTEDATLELVAQSGFTGISRAVPADDPTRWGGGGDMEVLPLRRGMAVVGLLLLDAETAQSMSEALKVALTATIASHLANARLLVRSRLEIRRARALRGVIKELTGNLDLADVVGDIVERTRTMFGADRAGVWLFDDSPHPIPLATRNLSADFLRSSAELTHTSEAVGLRALDKKRTLWLRNAHSDPATGEMRAAYAAEGIRTVCFAPLINHGRALGVIGLYHDRDRIWTDEDVELAQAFADQAAVAIQNARLYRSVEEHAARMRSIQDLSARLNRLTDVEAIAQAIVDEARTIAEYHDIRVYRVDHERQICEPIAFTRDMLEGDQSLTEALLTLEVGEGFTGWVAEHGEPLLINNTLEDPRGKTIEGTDDIPESMLVVPMLYEGRTLGVIVLSQLGLDRFAEGDLQTMGIFAGYAAQALANASTYGQLTQQTAELERRADSQRRLLEVNQRLLWTLDQGDVLDSIADGLHEVVAYDNLSIYRVDHGRGAMVPVLARETHAEAVGSYLIPFGRGLMGWAVEHREAILANDALADPRAVQVPGTPADPEAVIVVPLVADGDVLGAMNLSRMGGAEAAFAPGDFELVQLFAAQASIALRNADAHHEMSRRAETDALTGLGNHGAFQRDLARAVEAVDSEAHGEGLALLMMDLDRFKSYNDHHGHPAGDELLRGVAAALRATARGEDGVYRYGGDEFAVTLPHTSVEDAVRVAKRLCAAVAALSHDDPTPVTITVGVAGLPLDAADRAGLVAAADAALYFGKRTAGGSVARADAVPRRRRSDATHEDRDAA